MNEALCLALTQILVMCCLKSKLLSTVIPRSDMILTKGRITPLIAYELLTHMLPNCKTLHLLGDNLSCHISAQLDISLRQI